MTDDIIERFLRSSTNERFAIARAPANLAALRDHFGPQAVDEYLNLADDAHRLTSQRHLSLKTAPNLLFVPGLTGTVLFSQTLGGVWWIDFRSRHHIDDLRLSADGTSDADPNNRVLPVTTDISYEPFLKAALTRDDFGHDVLPYDWRKPLTASSTPLRDKVLAMHTANGGRPVHLVAHSMGGLLVRVALMEYGDVLWSKVGRIVFLGSPHYGSPAIAGYLKNHLWGFDTLVFLAKYLSRDTFRSLWGALSLLPAPRGVYPGTRANDAAPDWGDADDSYRHPCANFDLYSAASWKLGLSTEQEAQLQRVLDGAADFHRKLYDAHRKLNQELRDRMAVIVGVGMRTLFRLAYQKHLWVWESMEKTFDRVPGNSHRDGDGRVPVASAKLENVGAVRFVKGVHGELPNIPAVYNDVFRWLNGEELMLPTSAEDALSHHLSGSSEGSQAPHLDGAARANRGTGDPGYWQLSEAGESAMETDTLDERKVAEFNRLHLL